MAKSDIKDADASAKIVITPIVQEINGIKCVVIVFNPEHTKNLEINHLIHSARAISADGHTVFVLFNGQLTITQNIISEP